MGMSGIKMTMENYFTTFSKKHLQENILEDDREIASSSASIEICDNLIMVPIMTESDDQIPEAYIDILQNHSRDIATCTLPFKRCLGYLPNTISPSLWTCPFQMTQIPHIILRMAGFIRQNVIITLIFSMPLL